MNKLEYVKTYLYLDKGGGGGGACQCEDVVLPV